MQFTFDQLKYLQLKSSRISRILFLKETEKNQSGTFATAVCTRRWLFSDVHGYKYIYIHRITTGQTSATDDTTVRFAIPQGLVFALPLRYTYIDPFCDVDACLSQTVYLAVHVFECLSIISIISFRSHRVDKV